MSKHEDKDTAAQGAAGNGADTGAEVAAADAEEAAGDSAATAPAAPTVESLQEELAAEKDKGLRLLAELENTRRRAEKQVSDARLFSLQGFALEVGEVRDLLEKALQPQAAGDGDAAGEKLREGVSLTLRKLVSVMEARHIFPINPDVGAAFDPDLHAAIGRLPATEQAAPDTVAAVVAAGWMLNGRMIRPASVMVASAPDEDAAPDSATPANDAANDAADDEGGAGDADAAEKADDSAASGGK